MGEWNDDWDDVVVIGRVWIGPISWELEILMAVLE